VGGRCSGEGDLTFRVFSSPSFHVVSRLFVPALKDFCYRHHLLPITRSRTSCIFYILIVFLRNRTSYRIELSFIRRYPAFFNDYRLTSSID